MPELHYVRIIDAQCFDEECANRIGGPGRSEDMSYLGFAQKERDVIIVYGEMTCEEEGFWGLGYLPLHVAHAVPVENARRSFFCHECSGHLLVATEPLRVVFWQDLRPGQVVDLVLGA